MNKKYQNMLPGLFNAGEAPNKGLFGAPLRGGFTLLELFIKRSHSRGMLSGIFHFLNCCLCLINGQKAGDPRQKLSGMTTLKPLRMTTLFNKRMTASHGFTLTELLVVVLIIGILAAAALPQYRFAVERSRAAEAVVNTRAFYDAVQRYYMANGAYPATYAEAIENIDITLPKSKNFQYHYYNDFSTVYVGYIGNWYMISRTLASGIPDGVARGLTCNTNSQNNDHDFGAKICKSLCGVSTLEIVWGSQNYGCAIK